MYCTRSKSDEPIQRVIQPTYEDAPGLGPVLVGHVSVYRKEGDRPDSIESTNRGGGGPLIGMYAMPARARAEDRKRFFQPVYPSDSPFGDYALYSMSNSDATAVFAYADAVYMFPMSDVRFDRTLPVAHANMTISWDSIDYMNDAIVEAYSRAIGVRSPNPQDMTAPVGRHVSGISVFYAQHIRNYARVVIDPRTLADQMETIGVQWSRRRESVVPSVAKSICPLVRAVMAGVVTCDEFEGYVARIALTCYSLSNGRMIMHERGLSPGDDCTDLDMPMFGHVLSAADFLFLNASDDTAKGGICLPDFILGIFEDIIGPYASVLKSGVFSSKTPLWAALHAARHAYITNTPFSVPRDVAARIERIPCSMQLTPEVCNTKKLEDARLAYCNGTPTRAHVHSVHAGDPGMAVYRVIMRALVDSGCYTIDTTDRGFMGCYVRNTMSVEGANRLRHYWPSWVGANPNSLPGVDLIHPFVIVSPNGPVISDICTSTAVAHPGIRFAVTSATSVAGDKMPVAYIPPCEPRPACTAEMLRSILVRAEFVTPEPVASAVHPFAVRPRTPYRVRRWCNPRATLSAPDGATESSSPSAINGLLDPVFSSPPQDTRGDTPIAGDGAVPPFIGFLGTNDEHGQWE